MRSIRGKIDELLSQWSNEYPHILCFSEHHLREQEISKLCCSPYILAAKYCRNISKSGGVCIYMHESLSFTPMDVGKFCKEHEIEVRAVKLCLMSSTYCVISVYRSPSGNIPYFISTLDSVLNKLHSTSINLILCGDMNINYLGNSNNKTQLDSLLALYSLYNIIDFPTRIDNKSSTAIDGIFIDKYKFNNYSIIPVVNGLSDHYAQLSLLNNLEIQNSKFCCYTKRHIKRVNIENFKLNLSF
jgi:exonuclease III